VSFLFEIPQPSVAVLGMDKRFPVNRVYCVGRNYAAHAIEMGSSDREAPFFFSKPSNAVIFDGKQIPYPSRTADLHHEVELVVALGPNAGCKLTQEQANEAIFGYAVGIDFTRRDLQAEAKNKGRPWDTSKGFDFSAPVSAITPRSACGLITSGEITLSVNGSQRQHGDISDLIWNVAEVIAELSTYYRLSAGDLIFTGTPAGVGAVGPGDLLEAKIDGLQPLNVRIV
jgi:fumarylpyruvate hydrolase